MDLLFLHRLESLLVVRLIRTNAKHLDRMTHIMWSCGTRLSTGSYIVRQTRSRCFEAGVWNVEQRTVVHFNHEDGNLVLPTSLCLFLSRGAPCIGRWCAASVSYAVVWFRLVHSGILHGLPLECSTWSNWYCSEIQKDEFTTFVWFVYNQIWCTAGGFEYHCIIIMKKWMTCGWGQIWL